MRRKDRHVYVPRCRGCRLEWWLAMLEGPNRFPTALLRRCFAALRRKEEERREEAVYTVH